MTSVFPSVQPRRNPAQCRPRMFGRNDEIERGAERCLLAMAEEPPELQYSDHTRLVHNGDRSRVHRTHDAKVRARASLPRGQHLRATNTPPEDEFQRLYATGKALEFGDALALGTWHRQA